MNFTKTLVAAAILTLACTPHINAQKTKLKTDADSASFYLGYLFGKQLAESGTQVGVTFDVDILIKGLKEAAGKKPTQLDNLQINDFMNSYFTSKQTEAGEKNLKEGADFLEANGRKDGVVTLPSGLQYRVIRDGTGTKPQPDDQVDVMYHGTLIDGTVFDSSRERGEPVSLSLAGVVPGFSEALMLMNEGSLWEVYIPSELAYGERGMSTIKPNSVLVFEIELLKINTIEVEE
ncbi:MAG: FKBP-type peptidyl-prolyl cis-trans isomerase [Bacteroidales bacterium]|jgi:FKBP-type peptidyl-prolyl cis-trans isomerase FklB|nr:FKBP-type peptidyl-prolyl cis-trans isomerase [Bacteroidales bacterium]